MSKPCGDQADCLSRQIVLDMMGIERLSMVASILYWLTHSRRFEFSTPSNLMCRGSSKVKTSLQCDLVPEIVGRSTAQPPLKQ